MKRIATQFQERIKEEPWYTQHRYYSQSKNQKGFLRYSHRSQTQSQFYNKKGNFGNQAFVSLPNGVLHAFMLYGTA